MSQPHKTLLILPGGFGDGPAHRDYALGFGLKVIGASSVENDPAAADYAEWVWLPHIADPGFEAALGELIARRGVDQVHVTHDAILHRLQKILPALAPQVELTHGRTLFDLEADYRGLLARAAKRPAILELAAASEPKPPLSDVEVAGFVRAAMSIPGQSEEDKLMALAEVARRAPGGDIVEIGSFMGRTAAFFSMLSGRYGLGKVLCVDPWEVEAIDQGADALKEFAQVFDWAYWRQIFEVNVAPFAAGRLNYIHAYSVQGAEIYSASPTITTPTFGETRYEGRIGILYIDGNHGYDHVLADCQAWAPHVKPGGWIVFDDYEWNWGDGVRRVGDAFLAEKGEAVRCAFVAAGALFVQLN